MFQLENKIRCQIIDLGFISYTKAYEMQKNFVCESLHENKNSLLFCEHPTILTIGRVGDKNNILIPRDELLNMGIDVKHVDRGGDITLHSPGQLVIYPIFNLKDFGKDLHLFLRKLEQVAIDLLRKFDILARRSPGKTGVWVNDKKIVSIGIGVRKWISYHGVSINVNTDLKLFSIIKPCGLDVQMTSFSDVSGNIVNMKEVKENLISCFKENFNLIL